MVRDIRYSIIAYAELAAVMLLIGYILETDSGIAWLRSRRPTRRSATSVSTRQPMLCAIRPHGLESLIDRFVEQLDYAASFSC